MQPEAIDSQQQDGRASPIAPQPQSERRSQPSTGASGARSTSRRQRLDERVLARFWRRMSFDLGYLWTSRYGDAAFDADGGLTDGGAHWAEALGDLTPQAIAVGLAAMRDAGAQWRPTVPAFRELCGPAIAPSTRPEHQPWKSLPAPERPDPEAVSRYREAMGAAKAKASIGRRCIYSPGYGHAEHEAALAAAQRDGRSLYGVDMAAKARNGWTEADESHWRAAWYALPHLGAPYRRGHEPRQAAQGE